MHITSPAGTDVTMRIDGRPLDLDVGVVSDEAKLSNLPAGEVCLAPLETEADGTVVFDLAFWNGVRIEELETRFQHGVCHPVGAKTGFETFAGVLANASGPANVIGELGIGLNPAVGAPCGYAHRRGRYSAPSTSPSATIACWAASTTAACIGTCW